MPIVPNPDDNAVDSYPPPHTPAPWKYRTADGIHAGGKRIAALSYAGKAISQKVTYEELAANGRLLADAPRLLEENKTLREALSYLAAQINLSKLNVRKDFSLLNAHAAALKALNP